MSEFFRGLREDNSPKENSKEILVTIKGKESFFVDRPEKRGKKEAKVIDSKEVEATPEDLLQDKHEVGVAREKIAVKEAEKNKYESRWYRNGKPPRGAGHDAKYKDYV